MNRKTCYYISQLVRVLRLVNLAGYILLYGPLKLKAVFVAKMSCNLSPSVLNFLASKSLKLPFTPGIVYYNLPETYESLNNDFKLTRFAFE